MKINVNINGENIDFYVKKKRIKHAYLRAKNDGFYITCPLSYNDENIKKLVREHLDFIYKNFPKKKENIIHFLGKSYSPKFYKGSKNYVFLNDDNICLISKNGTKEEYIKVLDKFYQEELKKVLDNLIITAKNDYQEIVFPKVTLAHLKRSYGNYNKGTNLIKLSISLAKYDIVYIKSVLYHELTHVFEMNHSEKFYKKYEEKFKDAKMIQKRLKQIEYNDLI